MFLALDEDKDGLVDAEEIIALVKFDQQGTVSKQIKKETEKLVKDL